jgi:hypothetical protein
MPIEVELDVFSGRPNPKWSLGPLEETEFFERMSSLPAAAGSSFPEPPGLGYRGLNLRISGENEERDGRVYHGVLRIGGELKTDLVFGLEKWLLETARSVDPQLLAAIKRELR